MDNLAGVLYQKWQQTLVELDEEDLKQIIHDVGILFIPVIEEAKSFTESYDRWLEEFYLLTTGKESLLKSKAVIRKQRKAQEIVSDLLKGWWNISDEELFMLAKAIFKSAYEDALDDFANEVWQELYEQGMVEDPMPIDNKATLVNAIILGEIDAYAQQMVDNLNKGSQYYLKRALARAVMTQLSKPEIREQINEGIDPGEIIATLGLIDDIAAAFKSDIMDLIVPRAERAAAFEISNIEGAARLKAMSRMGLTTKQWNTWGPDPCLMCISNAARGSVPLDHQYDSAFGTCLWPLAHPFGECGISFDKSELADKMRVVVDTGGEITLYRGD